MLEEAKARELKLLDMIQAISLRTTYSDAYKNTRAKIRGLDYVGQKGTNVWKFLIFGDKDAIRERYAPPKEPLASPRKIEFIILEKFVSGWVGGLDFHVLIVGNRFKKIEIPTSKYLFYKQKKQDPFLAYGSILERINRYFDLPYLDFAYILEQYQNLLKVRGLMVKELSAHFEVGRIVELSHKNERARIEQYPDKVKVWLNAADFLDFNGLVGGEWVFYHRMKGKRGWVAKHTALFMSYGDRHANTF
ncbi:MAG: hypothetical protein FWF59_06095 [Turicibacter sp.]|nr:hypothetical protein [Turicibacter sp.]